MGTHFNEQTIKQILQEYKEGNSPTQLGKKYGIARSTVYRWIQERRECSEQITVSISAREMYENKNRLHAYSLRMKL